MTSCDAFRSTFRPGTEDAELLAHLRACDRCLDHAAGIDPDAMFRALGGGELLPPGGIDSFVSGVMQQVRVRDAERRMAPRRTAGWIPRLAVAATVAAGMTGTLLVYRATAPVPMAPVPSAMRAVPAAVQASLTTKPVVETYQGANATIVEVPAEPSDDVKIVMIFDESLPADL